MNITYDKSINETLLPHIKTRIEPFAILFPDWCQNLIIFYEPTNPEHLTLSCVPDYNYRFVQIMVYPGFFDDPAWKVSIIHEISHALQAPYTSKVESIVRNFITNETLVQYLIEELAKEEEATTQDIAKMVTTLDSPKLPML